MDVDVDATEAGRGRWASYFVTADVCRIRGLSRDTGDETEQRELARHGSAWTTTDD